MMYLLMGLNKKMFLADKILELLNMTSKTQVDLAKYAGIKQGHVNDHIRGKAYPKFPTLAKYTEFFSLHLGRKLTFYELTGDEIFINLDKQIRNIPGLPEKAKQFVELFEKLPDDKKKIIEQMIKALHDTHVIQNKKEE